MTEDLRALLRADLGAERPPPLGDVVEAAIRDGLRIRRRRRAGTLLGSFAVIAVLASGAVIVGGEGIADGHGPAAVAQRERAVSPQSVPPALAAPTALPPARSLTIHSGTVRAHGPRGKATPAAMLHLLTQLIPPGRTSRYGAFRDNDLRVQLYLDDGTGPAVVRVGLERPTAPGSQVVPGNTTNVASAKSAPVGDETTREGPIRVTIQHMPDNCLQTTVVDAAWPDGTLVRVDVPTCLPAAGAGPARPSRAALTPDEAVRVAADPRWGVTMEAGLLQAGKKMFPRVAVLS